MLSRVYSFAAQGIEAKMVEVEVVLRTGGQEAFIVIVGLPDTAVKESKERLYSAMLNAGFSFPRQRVLINLAPADLKKQGPVFDLPMAVAILMADGQIPAIENKEVAFAGELSLDGGVRSIRGALSIAIAARKNNFKKLIVPLANVREAALVPGIDVYPVSSLNEAVQIFERPELYQPFVTDYDLIKDQIENIELDFNEIKGQGLAKRGAEIAAAGGHNILFVGPPGAGKSMLAKRMPALMPPMTLEEAIETTKIHSIRGLLSSEHPIVNKRPFRAPHHTISDAGLIGGGTNIEPGEVSLSHNGVLFLDEFPEFSRRALEVLRQPLEDGQVTISRVAGTLKFPAEFMLVAAMNPCPCGYRGFSGRECTCGYSQISRYQSKLSGPMLDRIDLHVEMPAVKYSELANHKPGESTAAIRARCQAARDIQVNRLKGSRARNNAQMTPRQVRQYCQIDSQSAKILEMAINKLVLSARAYDRILRVSRTIADLAGRENIISADIMEAIQYRNLDRSEYWN